MRPSRVPRRGRVGRVLRLPLHGVPTSIGERVWNGAVDQALQQRSARRRIAILDPQYTDWQTASLRVLRSLWDASVPSNERSITNTQHQTRNAKHTAQPRAHGAHLDLECPELAKIATGCVVVFPEPVLLRRHFRRVANPENWRAVRLNRFSVGDTVDVAPPHSWRRLEPNEPCPSWILRTFRQRVSSRPRSPRRSRAFARTKLATSRTSTTTCSRSNLPAKPKAPSNGCIASSRRSAASSSNHRRSKLRHSRSRTFGWRTCFTRAVYRSTSCTPSKTRRSAPSVSSSPMACPCRQSSPRSSSSQLRSRNLRARSVAHFS